MTRIAVLSDTHDNIWNLDQALQQVAVAAAEVLLHCGDFVAPFVIPQLGEAFGGPIHGVYGNNDGDQSRLYQQATRFPQVILHGEFAALEVDGVRIAMNHYPEIARPLAESGRYDLVCYGHDHVPHWEQVGECQLVNPGEIMGRRGSPSWGLFDTSDRTWHLQSLQA